MMFCNSSGIVQKLELIRDELTSAGATAHMPWAITFQQAVLAICGISLFFRFAAGSGQLSIVQFAFGLFVHQTLFCFFE
jgi:hypothetical protein